MKVTTELKKTLRSLGIDTNRITFSDPRSPDGIKNSAVGVKFCDMYLFEYQKNKVIEMMTRKGFAFWYIHVTPTTSDYGYSGTRFCFAKKIKK